MDRASLMAAMEAAASSKPLPVDVPAWGGTVYVRQLTVAEVEEQTEDTEQKADKHRIARATARVLCDEHGVRLFDPRSDADVALIGRQPWNVLRAILAKSNPDTPGNA